MFDRVKPSTSKGIVRTEGMSRKLVEASTFHLPKLATVLKEKEDVSVDNMFDRLLTEGARAKRLSVRNKQLSIAESCDQVASSNSRSIQSQSSGVADKQMAGTNHTTIRSGLDVYLWMQHYDNPGAKLAQRLLKRMRGGKPDSTMMAQRFPNVLVAQMRSKNMDAEENTLIWFLVVWRR